MKFSFFLKYHRFIYLARKSFAVSDNSDGISGACLSLPSLSNNAPVLTTNKIKSKFKHLSISYLYETAFYL